MKACVTFAVIVALLGLHGVDQADAVYLSRDAPQVHVVGGSVRQNGDFKFLLDVIETTLTLFPTHKGVAVLLNPNWALTTKVAVTPGFGKAVHLEYGKSKGGVGRSVDISQTVVHSDGVLTLVKLKKAIAYDTLTKPVNLPFSGVDNSDMMALLAGWTTDDKELRSAAVRVLSTDECKAKGVAVDTQLCTADAQVATCNTDDGSPLVQDMKNGVYKLVGIATETKGVKCPPAAGDVRKYYDVSKYIDWIFSNAFA